MRKIRDSFIKELNSGQLKWILKEVKCSKVLSLEIRDNYVNIYYRGGRILKIIETGREKNRKYTFQFDKNYGERKKSTNILSDISIDFYNISNKDAEKYFDRFKNAMDGWFSEHSKPEREWQHNVSLPQNNMVIDIEYAISKLKMRLDMIMLDENGVMYLIENKYGFSALSSKVSEGSKAKKENPDAVKSGLSKHYTDFINLLNDQNSKNELIESIRQIKNIKSELGLLKGNPQDSIREIRILYVLADFNPPIEKVEMVKNIVIEECKKIKNEMPNDYEPYVLICGKNEHKIDLNKIQKLVGYDFDKILLSR